MMDEHKPENLNIKRFGYVISALLLIISNISLISNWPSTPILFLITMYFLTGALWAPFLIKPFYQLFGKNLFKNTDDNEQLNNSDDLFNKN